MDRNASSSEPRRRLSRSPTPHSLADDDSVSTLVLEQQLHPPSTPQDIYMDMKNAAESAAISLAAAPAAPGGLQAISPRNGGASAPQSELPDATNSHQASAQISSAGPPLSDRLRLFASLSRMSAEEIEVARQTEANTLNNHRFTAPTESERAATSPARVTGKRKSNSTSSQSSLFLPSSTQQSAPSSSFPTPIGATTDNDIPASPSYLADDETEGDEDSYASDASFTGSPHPSSSSQVRGATRNRQKRRRLDEVRTLANSEHTGDQLPKSLIGIIRHPTASRRQRKGYSSSSRKAKTVRFDESRNTILDYDSSSTIALSDEDIYRIIHSGATSPPRSAINRNSRSLVSLLDHGLMRSPWSAWSAELNKASRPISSDTAPIPSHSSRPGASETTGGKSVGGNQSPANSSQARAAGLTQLWSPPRLRLSFSDISSANSATISTSRAATSPSTPPLEKSSSPNTTLPSSIPSLSIAPRMPVLQRYATLPMSSAPSLGSSDARLLVQYEGLSIEFSEEMDENTSGDQKDGHLSSSEHSLLTRLDRARLTSPPRRIPRRGEILDTLALETGRHPYRRSGPNAPMSPVRDAPPRLVRSASLSTPEPNRTPSLRREASSTSLLDILS